MGDGNSAASKTYCYRYDVAEGGKCDYFFVSAIPTIIDMLLDELQHIVDTYLPIIAVVTDLTWAESQAIIENFDKFVADVEGMEHGTIEIATGVIDICIDILRVLEAFGIDVTLPCEFRMTGDLLGRNSEKRHKPTQMYSKTFRCHSISPMQFHVCLFIGVRTASTAKTIIS